MTGVIFFAQLSCGVLWQAHISTRRLSAATHVRPIGKFRCCAAENLDFSDSVKILLAVSFPGNLSILFFNLRQVLH